MALSKERKFVLRCLADYIAGVETVIPEKLKWDIVQQTAFEQQVPGAVYYQCRNCDEADAFKQAIEAKHIKASSIDETLELIVEWLSEDSEIEWEYHLASLLKGMKDNIADGCVVFRQFAVVAILMGRLNMDWEKFFGLVGEVGVEKFVGNCFAFIKLWFFVDIVEIIEKSGYELDDAFKDVEVGKQFYDKTTEFIFSSSASTSELTLKLSKGYKAFKKVSRTAGYVKDFAKYAFIVTGATSLHIMWLFRAVYYKVKDIVVGAFLKVGNRLKGNLDEKKKAKRLENWGIEDSDE